MTQARSILGAPPIEVEAVLDIDCDLPAPADIDAWLAQDLTAEKLSCKPFSPLPVLGVPGWWDANQDPAFYEDTRVFRPRRVKVAA